MDGINPAPRGMPQIEVTFDIDAATVSCTFPRKIKTAVKEQKITIKVFFGVR
ncbi:Hsp70 family protein [Escherichia coli]